jgi:hypothetical protein
MAGKSFLVCSDIRNHVEFLDAQMCESEAIRSSLFRLMDRSVIDPLGKLIFVTRMCDESRERCGGIESI